MDWQVIDSANSAARAAELCAEIYINEAAAYFRIDGDSIEVFVMDESGKETTWLVSASTSISYYAESVQLE